MEKQSTLQEILGVEKALREQLDAERQQASRWLESTRGEIATEHHATLERLRQDAALTAQAAQRSAEEKAANLLQTSEGIALDLERCQDDELRRRVRAAVEAILPGATDAR